MYKKIVLAAVVCMAAQETLAAAHKRPTWETLSKQIDAYFATVQGYQRGGIITQSNVEPLWQYLAQSHWEVPQAEREAILKLIPTDKEFMVRHLRTAAGRRFMRDVATKYPEIYDRLDLLSHTPGGGRPAVSGLIAAPDAELTVKYMMSKNGSKSWASMLPERKSFNKPTGRIYTADALKARLHQLYQRTNGPEL